MRIGNKNRYNYVKNKNIVKVQRTIDMMAYGSLLLDIFIALLTALSLFNIRTGEEIMAPIHILLTAVVILSLLSGSMLLFLKHNEKIKDELYRIRWKIKMPFPSQKKQYTFKWKTKRKIKDFFRLS